MSDRQQIHIAAFEEVLRQMPAAVLIAEAPSGEIIFRNRLVQRIRERSLRQAWATHLEDAGAFQIYHLDGRPYEMEEWPLMRSIREGEEVKGEELIYPLADGSELVLRCDSSPIYDDDEGRIVAAVAVSYDITEQKRAEEGLRESGRRIENILESITDAFYTLDREWCFTYINERGVHYLERVNGAELTREDLLGKSIWEVFPEAVGSELYQKYHEALLEQKRVEFEEYSPWSCRWMEVHAYPTEEGLSVYGHDVTERKLAEQELETRTQQQAVIAELGLRSLANDDLQDLMDDIAALVARTLDVEYCKISELLPGGEQLVLRWGVGWKDGSVGVATEGVGDESQAGYTLRSEGPVVVEDLGPETRFEASPLELEHGAVSGMSVVIPGRRGPFGVLGVYARSLRIFSEDDVNFLQAVANVIAMRIGREEVDRELRRVSEAERSRLARNLHDEALQDLAYAMAQGQLARVTPDEAADRPGRMMAALKRVEQQLRGAIYDLRLEAEQDRPFHELLDELVELHRGMAQEGAIHLEVGDGVLDGPLGDRGREVLRILGEALTNARRHSGAHNVWVTVWTSEGNLLGEVSDDGRGFDRAEGPPAGAASGTGMCGMRERAQSLGATLEVESEPGKGTSVRFELPLQEDRVESAEDVRVFLVEDHVIVREAIASTFEHEAGFEVVAQAGSLAEAREMLDAVEMDVAVIDLGLPDGYGGDLIMDLRATNPRVQALVLSARLDRVDIARAVEAGAAAVLHKTAHLERVVDAVRAVKAGETLLPLQEIAELLRFAGEQREREYDARQAIARLTPREKEVLQALANGLDSREIADRLHISLRTERNHMASILAKLEVHSQLQALVFAVRHGVVEIP